MFLSLFASLAISAAREQNPFHISAPWAPVPLFDHILYFLSEYDSKKVKPYLLEFLPEGVNDETKLMEWSQSSLSQESFAFLNFTLAIGSYLPKMEAYRQISLSLEGSDLSEVFLVGEAPDFTNNYPFHPSKAHPTTPHEITFGISQTFVYADLHCLSAASFVKSLILSSSKFMLRSFARTKSASTNLKGYGIELVPSFSQEFNFSDFHLRLISYLADKPLISTLKNISSNWPLYVPEIMESDPTPQASLSMLRFFLHQQSSMSLLNGRLLPISGINAYSFLHFASEEKRLNDILSSHFSLNSSAIRKIVGSQISTDQSSLLDYRHSHIFFFNDVTKDKESKEWPTSSLSLIQSQTAIPKVKCNLLNFVLHINPLSETGIIQMLSVATLIRGGLPIRLGIVPYFYLGNRTQRYAAFAFYHLSKKSQKMAISFLLEAIHISGIDDEKRKPNGISDESFIQAYKKVSKGLRVLEWSELPSLMFEGSEEEKMIEETNIYLMKSGIELGTATLNGAIVDLSGNQQSLINQIQRTITSIKQAIVGRNMRDLETVDVMDLLSDTNFLSDSIDVAISKSPIEGFGFFDMNETEQEITLDFLKTVDWSGSFWILFTDEATELDAFKEFIGERGFSLNPKMPEFLKNRLNINNHNSTNLIVGGRIFRNIDITNINRLKFIDQWTQRSVKVPQNYPDLAKFMSMLMVDWRQRGIQRSEFVDDSWNLNYSLCEINEGESMRWDIYIDPLSTDFQRNIEMIKYVKESGLASVRLMAIPNENFSRPSFYRASIATDILTLPEDFVGSIETKIPKSWQLDNSSQTSFFLKSLLYEGGVNLNSAFPDTNVPLILENSNGVPIRETFAIEGSGYFQFPITPGLYSIKLPKNINYMSYNDQILIDSFSMPHKELIVNGKINIEYPTNSAEIYVLSYVNDSSSEEAIISLFESAVSHSSKPVHFFVTGEPSASFLNRTYQYSISIIEYSWPSWLYKPSDPRSYDMMFLDVILPINVTRVILATPSTKFGSNLEDLFNIGLNNSAYGFYKVEEDQSQNYFWRSGVWQKIIGNRPFFNTSFGIVDIARFRSLHIGHLIRHHYLTLLRERQIFDLISRQIPNILQEHAPIFTLPRVE